MSDPIIPKQSLGLARSSGIEPRKADTPHAAARNVIDEAPQHRSDEQTIEELSVSLPTMRALVAGEVPAEIRAALEGFALLGDLDGLGYLCDRLEAKGLQHVQWPVTSTLRQALERAAS